MTSICLSNLYSCSRCYLFYTSWKGDGGSADDFCVICGYDDDYGGNMGVGIMVILVVVIV